MYDNLWREREKRTKEEARSWVWCLNSRTWNTKTEDHKFKNRQGRAGGKRKQGGDGKERRPFQSSGRLGTTRAGGSGNT